MRKVKKENSIVHSTSSGKLYIKTNDFFSQPKVQKMINEMMESDIYKSIEARKLAKSKK